MAHTCPYCFQLCHCKGDIDDIDLGHEPRGGCIHYKECEPDKEDEYYDDDFDDEGLRPNKQKPGSTAINDDYGRV